MEMESNAIAKVTADDFKGMVNLKQIVLSHNVINTIAGDAFKDNTNLRYAPCCVLPSV